MARDGDHRLTSLTLLASQVDFTEPGELQRFINDSQLAFVDSVMWKQGYLDTTQMAGAFQMLRSNDLFWSRLIRDYLIGERQPVNDLMAWNADATRMPYAMHSEYLRKLYLGNDLAEGRIDVDGRPVALSDIRAPVFAVGTERDHVAPWPSVFKIQALTRTDVTFVLTSRGHNAGIVSEPGHPRRSYRTGTKRGICRKLLPGAMARSDLALCQIAARKKFATDPQTPNWAAGRACRSAWLPKSSRGSPVIPPFLTGCVRRTYAAIFSFWAGVMPPMPMFGRSLL